MPDVAPGTRRNIVFITTDQQRYDSLACNGGSVARTPVADRLAAEGISYRRAYNQNTVCMPARSTMLTGQYVRTVYERSTAGKPNGLEEVWGPRVLDLPSVLYEAERTGPGGISIATGELYDVSADPWQWHNRWDDSTVRSLREDLIGDLYDRLPGEVRSLEDRGAGVTGSTTEIDGRALRSVRSREAVVDAMLDLLDEGSLRPGAAEVAEAGVSVRTVFRHFEDLEQLFATATDHQARRIAPLLLAPPPTGARWERIAGLVGQRVDLYERIGPVRRAALRHEPFHQAVHEGLIQARRLLRRHLLASFAPELDGLQASARATTVAALETATSFAAWDNLHVEQHLSVAQAGAAVTAAVVALLEHGR